MPPEAVNMRNGTPEVQKKSFVTGIADRNAQMTQCPTSAMYESTMRNHLIDYSSGLY